MDKQILGTRIRQARKEKKWTQAVLAEKVDIGLNYMGEIERGDKYPSMNVFVKLVEALDVSADSLLRDRLATGKEHVYHELTQKLDPLTPKQLNAISELIDVYIRNL